MDYNKNENFTSWRRQTRFQCKNTQQLEVNQGENAQVKTVKLVGNILSNV